MRPRGIDHLVIAVRDLDRARATYQRLGFTLTPEARHPFGTKNSLVQLQGAFLELVSLGDSAAISEPTPERFSFAAFNRDYLAKRDGLSMLVLKSRDANVDHAEFATQGLAVYEPIHFERVARAPDGTERKVAFTMSFTSEPRILDAGFFTCQHHFPENFWRAEYQSHPNGARSIESAAMVARDPNDVREFLAHLTGVSDVKSTSHGMAFDTGEGRIQVLTPRDAQAFFCEAIASEPESGPRFIGYSIGVADLAATAAFFWERAIPFAEGPGRLVVPAAEACGAAVAFAESSFPARSV